MKRLVKKAEIVTEEEKREILEAVFGEETTFLEEFHKNIEEVITKKEEI